MYNNPPHEKSIEIEGRPSESQREREKIRGGGGMGGKGEERGR